MRLKIDFEIESELKTIQTNRVLNQGDTLGKIRQLIGVLDATWEGSAAETFKSRFDILARHFEYLLEMYESCDQDIGDYTCDMTEVDRQLGGGL